MKRNMFSIARTLRTISLLMVPSLLGGCPATERPDSSPPREAGVIAPPALPADAGTSSSARPTHTALVSVQEIQVEGAAESTPMLTVIATFTPASAPDYEERPGDVTGCKAWSYDLDTRPPPREEDHGVLSLRGLQGGDLHCRFDPARGYVCNDVADAGTPGQLVTYGLPVSGPLAVSLNPNDAGAFQAFDVEVVPGAAFVLDQSSREAIDHIPLRGQALTLGCEGTGGTSGVAAASIVRITASDGNVEGLPPHVLPKPRRRAVEISCATLGAGSITIPEGAMRLLTQAHERSPLTRVRAAFMRDGVAVLTNPAPAAPNRVVVASGRGYIGFTQL